MLTAPEKQKAIEEARLHEKDTGSPEAQVAVLTEEINRLVSHLKKHPKDLHSKRGLLKMVAKRKSLLDYLKAVDEKRHARLAKKIG
jgi:small subunit ribosomal protein S15